MAYKLGQVVCLWQEKINPEEGIITVVREVLVTITEIKTGVPGEYSGTPTSLQSLRGVGGDGKVYKKHLERWPESQTNDFSGQWSPRDDGDDEEFPFWIPKEAVHCHSALNDFHRQFPDQKLERRDLNGQPIIPKGDVIYCERHDEYDHPGGKCFRCLVEEQAASAA